MARIYSDVSSWSDSGRPTAARIPPDSASEGSVHTFLFADVRGYTQFTVERGDAEAARLVQRFEDVARAVIEGRSGAVLEVRGDEILAVFASSRQALLAAAEIQGRLAQASQDDPSLPLSAGIGLDAGEAIAVGGGYRGAALNLASRLCSMAGPGEVLASEAVAHLAHRVEGLTYAERGMAQLKGFAQPVMIMQILAEAGETGATAETQAEEPVEQKLPIGRFLGALPPGALVARYDEMHQLLAAVDAVTGGQGRTIVLPGEPGAGKTRLAQEVSLNARNRRFVVATGRCYEQEASVPYYPFLDAFGALYAAAPQTLRQNAARNWPYLGALLPDELGVPDSGGASERDEQRVLRAATSFLEAITAHAPVALLLDDVHWADAASLKLLQHLARHTRGSPVFILVTYRDTELSLQHPLEAALRDLHREGLIERVAVRRLPPEGTAALASDAIGRDGLSSEFVELLYQRTEGNPYFIEQLIRMLMERGDIFQAEGGWTRRAIEDIELPESIRSVVGQRIVGLGEAARDVLHEASVLGQSFYFDDLLTMSQRAEADLDDALEEAGAAGLTASSDGELYRFDHALTRQFLYESLSPRRRRRLHLAAGTALEELAPRQRSQRVAELAWHFLHADDVPRALHFSMEAGDRAEAIFAHGDAEHHYRTALELAEDEGDRRQTAEIQRKLGRALRLSGRYDEALDVLERAAALYAKLDDREAELGVMAEIGQTHAQRGTSDEGIGRVLPLVRNLEHDGLETLSPARAASLYSSLAALYFRGGRWQDLVAAAEDASRLAESSGDDRLLAEAERERGRALALVGREEEAQTAVARAAQLAEKLGDLAALQGALNTLAYLQRRVANLQAATESYRRALDAAERLGDPSVLAFARSVYGRALVERGEWAEAQAQFERGLHEAEAAGSSWYATYPKAGLGVLALQQGEREHGLQLLGEAVDMAERNEDVQGLIFHAYLAQQEVLDGQTEVAITRLQRIRERSRGAGREIYRWELAWALLESGNVAEAAEFMRSAGEHLLYEGRIEMPDVLRVTGMIAARQGDLHKAAGHLEEGLELARQIGMPYHEALLLMEYGLLQGNLGSVDGARAALTEATAIFQRLGARPRVERASEALHALDTR